ncbi:hypothetical protein C2857_002186 [Epichloe festucae Fl1]|uniref:Chromo domain-containing protein n=1 Tax=Epichloe festucae (strain Fl1) TaxID=877507 RepID=A0A7S9KK54_EPIFF|nr:hypothetical protein C2857_002186 [Epichloe festucae Fl1]
MTQVSQISSAVTDDLADDSDSSVLSSTSEDVNLEDEWAVTRILAEAKIDGQEKYLIEWSGFELCDATWEPAEHLSQELLTDWKAAVERTGRTTVPGFKINDWRKAVNADIRSQYAKHEARNRKRALAGLSIRRLPFSLQEWLDSVQGPSEDENCDKHERDDQTLAELKTARREKAVDTSSAGTPTSQNPSETHREEPQLSRRPKRFKSPQGEDASLAKKRRPPEKSPTSPKEASSSRTASLSNLAGKFGSRKDSAALPSKDEAGKTPLKALTRNNSESTGCSSTFNVFVGGKQRKPRRNLLDAVSSHSRKSKLFNYRKIWMVEKARRDKEGITPPTKAAASLPLIPIRAGTTLNADKASQGTGKNDEVLQQSDHSHLPEYNGQKKKKVRWADDLEGEQEQSLDRFESLFVSEGEEEFEKSKGVNPGASNRDEEVPLVIHSSPDNSIETPLTDFKNMLKVCQFGPNPEVAVRLEFSGWTTDDKSPWSCHLRIRPQLHFSHLCSMHDLRSQTEHGALEEVTVCQGNIEANDEGKILFESIVKRLQVGQLAATCLLDGISIAIHVPEALSAANLLNNNGHPREGLVELRYLIFLSQPPISRLMLAPLPPVAYEERDLNAYEFFLGGTYERLFKNSASEGITQNFFLVFPQAAYHEAVMVSQWLRESDSGCTTKTSLLSGQWSEFTLLDRGNVILHEDAIWAIRSMPHLGSILHGYQGKKISFWCFSRYYLSSKGNDLTPGPSNYHLRQIFSLGIVILVTPSFLVSQPEQAYNFVKFFWQNYTHHSSKYRLGKLAVAYDVSHWLLDLAMEKADSSSRFAASNTSQQEKRAKASEEALFKCFNLVRQLIDETGDWEDSPFIYAPDILDGNDEQSLVNWFGSWTVSHNHSFRKFFVLGSSHQSQTRLSRKLQPVQLVPTANISSQGRMDSSPQLQNKPDVDAMRIRDSLIDIEQDYKSREFCPMVLYRYAVMGKFPDTPQHTESDTGLINFTRWFSFFAEPLFGRIHHIRTKVLFPAYKNTFVGLFYTTIHDQPPNPDLGPHQIKWSPWIAIYRPRNIFTRPWEKMELLIWDPDLAARVAEPEDLYDEDLMRPQRQLIDLIEKKTRDQESALPLDRVWLGPFGDFQDKNKGYVDDIDRALSWIKELPDSVKYKLPVASDSLPTRGWKCLNPGSRPASKATANSPSSVSLDPRHSQSQSLPVRAILEPPPGTTADWQAAPCRNYFRDAILGHRGPGRIPFTFQPTLKWYTRQLEAGMGFQHIIVSSWQSLFARYGIHDPEKE